MLTAVQAWFVIEDALEDGAGPQVISWRSRRDAAIEDAKAQAEAHHDAVYMIVAAEEGSDPRAAITPETLCVWHPGRVYDSGRVTGGRLLMEEKRQRETGLASMGPATNF